MSNLLLSSCTDSQKGEKSEQTQEELKDKYGARCLELSNKASKLVESLTTQTTLGQNEEELQQATNDTIRKAIQLLDEATQENPQYPKAYKLKAEYYAKLKNYDKAIENLKYCEQLLPKSEQGTIYFSEALLEYKRGQEREMTKLFEKALQIDNEILEEDPYNLEVIAEKAYLLSLLGEKDKAHKFLDSYKDNSKVDQKSLAFFREAIKTKHLICKLASDIN